MNYKNLKCWFHSIPSFCLSKLVFTQTYAVDVGAEIIEDCDRPDLTSVPAKDRTGRWARVTFKILLSYHGSSFDGWQKQHGLNTVQGLVFFQFPIKVLCLQ